MRGVRSVGASNPLDRVTLEERALRHLDRFDATAARLGAVLRRHVDRAVHRDAIDERNKGYALCSEVVARCVELGLVDDARYARNLTASLRRRGASAKAVEQRLVARGVARELARDVVRTLSNDEQGVSEFDAARALVRRRRLGSYRAEPERRERRNKDLAALARAGFSYEIARRALDLSPSDDGES